MSVPAYDYILKVLQQTAIDGREAPLEPATCQAGEVYREVLRFLRVPGVVDRVCSRGSCQKPAEYVGAMTFYCVEHRTLSATKIET